MAGAVIAAALSAALGVGVGMFVRNQVAGVVGALVWILILAPLLGLIDEDIPAYTNADAAGTVGGSEGEVLSWAGRSRSSPPGLRCSWWSPFWSIAAAT